MFAILLSHARLPPLALRCTQAHVSYPLSSVPPARQGSQTIFNARLSPEQCHSTLEIAAAPGYIREGTVAAVLATRQIPAAASDLFTTATKDGLQRFLRGYDDARELLALRARHGGPET